MLYVRLELQSQILKELLELCGQRSEYKSGTRASCKHTWLR